MTRHGQRTGLSRRDAWPLGAVGFILTVSVAWWALALWSVPGAPQWLARARTVCFNITETGLPDAKGWLLLLGQPPAMLTMLMVGWGGDVRASMRRVLALPAGRATTLLVAAGLLVGLGSAAVVVGEARLPPMEWSADEPAPETYPRLDRPWPVATGLVDASGAPFSLASLEGRPAMVTFAFGHCETICPIVVHRARSARIELERGWAIVVLTLDPWRDTPSRLSALVDQFALDPERDFVVSGSVESVNAALDAWLVPRERDERSGDVTHPAIVYFVQADGTISYASSGGVAQMVSLARRSE